MSFVKRKVVSILLIVALLLQIFPSMAFASASEAQEMQNLRRVILEKGTRYADCIAIETAFEGTAVAIKTWTDRNEIEFLVVSQYAENNGESLTTELGFVYDLNQNNVQYGIIIGVYCLLTSQMEADAAYASFNPHTYELGDVLTFYDVDTDRLIMKEGNYLFNQQLTFAMTLWNELCVDYMGISLGNLGFAAFDPIYPSYPNNPSVPNVPSNPAGSVIRMFIDSKTMYINGQRTATDVAPVVIQSRTMVPIRFVAENLGCDVDWNASTKHIRITQDGKVLNMTVGKNIPGFGAAPVIRSNRTLVPIRYVSEALGAQVDYNEAVRSVTITK